MSIKSSYITDQIIKQWEMWNTGLSDTELLDSLLDLSTHFQSEYEKLLNLIEMEEDNE